MWLCREPCHGGAVAAACRWLSTYPLIALRTPCWPCRAAGALLVARVGACCMPARLSFPSNPFRRTLPAALQVHYESWLACHRSAGSHLPAAAGAQQLTAPGSVRSMHSRASSFDGIDSPHTALLGRHHYFSTSASVGAEAQGPGGLSGGEVGREPSHTTHEYLAVEVGQARVPDTAAAGETRPSADIPAGGAPPAGPTAAGVGTEQPPASSGSGVGILASPLPPLVLPQPWAQQGPTAAAGEGSWAPGPVTSSDANTPFGPGGGSWRAPLGLWRPLSYDQRHTWRRVDWARFYFFRSAAYILLGIE